MLSKFFHRLFVIVLCGLLVFLDPSLAAYADLYAQNGSPVWSNVSFDNMGVVEAGNFGIIDDTSLINQIGYNPSRAFESGTPVSQTIKVGDLSVFGLGNRKVSDFLGGADPNKVSLGAFKAINGNTLNDLASSVPGLANLPTTSIPLVQAIVSGNNAGIANSALPFLQQVSPEIKNYLSANPWAKDLPLEQLLQGDWQGAALQGALKVGLPKLVEQFPALKNIPLGGILSAASTGDYKALIGVGISFGLSKLQGPLSEFLKGNPALANLPIGVLTNINNLSIGSIPNLASTALTSIPGLKNQIIKNVPGLANVPLESLLSLIKAATARIDFPDAGATTATRALTGGGYSFASTPCPGGVCSNFEINDAKALLFSQQLNGLQFVVGSNDPKKGQSVKGGKGPLAKMFKGKEPVHIRPWGDDPNVALVATKVDDEKGTVSFAFYLRVCADIPFVGRSCTPYGIGPIPFTTMKEGDTVVVISAGQPPINANNFTGDPCGSNGPSVDPNAPRSQQNIKRYLDRIAHGESSDGRDLGPNYLGATGKYQFIPSTRAGILEKYGYDGWNPAQWDNASIALIKDVGGQQTLNRIAAGDFAYADQVLNRTWTSLPGGAEVSPKWSNSSSIAQYGPINSATLVSSTSSSSSGSGSPKTLYGYSQQTQARADDLVPVTTRPGLGRTEYLHKTAAAAFEQMVRAAAGSGITLSAFSGFRSIPIQQGLWDAQVRKLGSPEAAAKVSAPPGYSEHQSGFAVDISNNNASQDLNNGFQNSAAYQWLKSNAAAYGFSQSYNGTPGVGADNEAWHWRYKSIPAPNSGTLVASNSASVCGAPIPCKDGSTCILLNPIPKGKIPSYGGMFDACRDYGCPRRHAGVDLQSPKGYQNWQRGPGENIMAAADGTVTELTPVGGRCGGIVGIKHPNPNLETRYVHMVQTFVRNGQPVKRGQFVGVEGNETPQGCGSSGTHLHYEIYIGGTATNPVKVKHDPPLPTAPG